MIANPRYRVQNVKDNNTSKNTMIQNFILEKTMKILKDSLIFFITVFFSFLTVSCKSKYLQVEKCFNRQTDSITVRECVLNESIKVIIENLIDDFESKIHKSPTVVVLNFFMEHNVLKVSFSSQVNLFVKRSDRLLYNQSYHSGCVFGKALILVSHNENTDSLASKYIKLKSDLEKFKIYYGGDLTTCMKTYHVLANSFEVEFDDCPDRTDMFQGR